MRRFIISDTHFGHHNIIEYCHRPFSSVEEMNETIIRKWNGVIGMDDVVYMLGDFTLSRKLDVIENLCSRLQGQKILIMGNHDTRKPSDYVSCGFKVATRKPMMVEPGVILMHEPLEDINLIAPNYIYFFGHVHDKTCLMDSLPNCRCVCVERNDYRPFDLDKEIQEIKKRMLGKGQKR